MENYDRQCLDMTHLEKRIRRLQELPDASLRKKILIHIQEIIMNFTPLTTNVIRQFNARYEKISGSSYEIFLKKNFEIINWNKITDPKPDIPFKIKYNLVLFRAKRWLMLYILYWTSDNNGKFIWYCDTQFSDAISSYIWQYCFRDWSYNILYATYRNRSEYIEYSPITHAIARSNINCWSREKIIKNNPSKLIFWRDYFNSLEMLWIFLRILSSMYSISRLHWYQNHLTWLPCR